MDLGCSALTPCHLWQSISMSARAHVHDVIRETWVHLKTFLATYPEESAILTRLLYPGGAKPKGWCWLHVVEEQDGGYGLRCAFLHTALFLHTMKPNLIFAETGIVFSSSATPPSEFVTCLDLLYVSQLSSIFSPATNDDVSLAPSTHFATSDESNPLSTDNSIATNCFATKNNFSQISNNFDPIITITNNAPSTPERNEFSANNQRSNPITNNNEANFITTTTYNNPENPKEFTKRKFETDSDQRRASRKKSKFESEMANFEGFRFGPSRAFVHDLQTIYKTLFKQESLAELSDLPWTWKIKTMATIICRNEIWKDENYEILISFVKKVMLYFKEDRDMLRNVILLYRKYT
eukprot:Phypoly_transcript_12983.p1 GENE.Phypoly_transcript_12983~~Phypoly_transcript_12983.p1  ORF type:complete len:360 (+),score=42.24 Phypoly_transcript_12983:25-1080(+)